ncbi:MAG: hypothetical protein QME81_19830, partial [bacterium]|nr:hypothetical protein [bacterium]
PVAKRLIVDLVRAKHEVCILIVACIPALYYGTQYHPHSVRSRFISSTRFDKEGSLGQEE